MAIHSIEKTELTTNEPVEIDTPEPTLETVKLNELFVSYELIVIFLRKNKKLYLRMI